MWSMHAYVSSSESWLAHLEAVNLHLGLAPTHGASESRHRAPLPESRVPQQHTPGQPLPRCKSTGRSPASTVQGRHEAPRPRGEGLNCCPRLVRPERDHGAFPLSRLDLTNV
jgi:hypothetical protein